MVVVKALERLFQLQELQTLVVEAVVLVHRTVIQAQEPQVALVTAV
jgi:hypothetical protein